VGSICQGPVKPAFNELGGCCPGEDNGQHGRQDRGADRGGAEHFVQADKGERQRDRDDQPGGGQQGPGGVAGPKGLAAADDADHHAGGDDRLDTPWGSPFFLDKPACPA